MIKANIEPQKYFDIRNFMFGVLRFALFHKGANMRQIINVIGILLFAVLAKGQDYVDIGSNWPGSVNKPLCM